MQETQRKTKQKAQQKKSNETSNEGFAVEQEMSNILDATNDVNEMPETNEFLENMETEVCNHYIILNKSGTQVSTTESTVLRLENK
jgi:hypothetical protein